MKTIHVGSRLHLAPENIVFIKADISYSHIFLSDGCQILVSTHLMKLERRFGDKMVRVHRSYLVNPDHVLQSQKNMVVTSNGQICPMSRRLRKDFK